MSLKQELDEKYKSGFLAQVEASQRGEVVFIPIGYDRMGKVFNLMPSRYTLISGATGSGKTSFADSTYILHPWTFIKANPDANIHWEALYFSLERKQMFKHAKWISWFIYRDHGMIVSADELMGWGERPVNDKGYQLIRSYDDEISELLEHVQIFDGKVRPAVIKRSIEARARALGTFYWADDKFVYRDDEPIYVKSFEVDGKIKQTKTGPKVYVELEHEGETFRLYQEEHRYFPKNPLTFVYVVVDGINLIGDKKDLDEVSEYIADCRDKYGFSPVIVVQQNRAMGDINRMKQHGEDLSPQIEDVFKSSQMGFDADLILGLFDAYRYKAFDKLGMHEGYHLKPVQGLVGVQSLLAPTGHSRFRSVHILKNTFGPDGSKFCMKFLGECNHFETLPFPDDQRMEEVYSDVLKGR